MTPTPEQSAIISAARDTQSNLMINALAGCAKTTTLVLIADALHEQHGVALAFNVKIKQELEKKFPKSWSIYTFNGLGHRAWGKTIGRGLAVEPKKLGKIVSSLHPDNEMEWDAIRQLTSSAMMAGMVPESYSQRGLIPDKEESWVEICDRLWIEPTERLIKLARRALVDDIRQGFQGIISFDDQIYLSTIFGGVFPRFPITLIDEAQDLSSLNHIQLARCSAGRIIAVGDPKQAIYAFRGAHSSSMEKIKELRKEWIELPLSTTFRCPQKIVLRQKQHAPLFQAYSTNIIGRILNGYRGPLCSEEETFGKFNSETASISWDWSDVTALGYNDIAILSRNNAQLIAMAFKLLRQRVGCKMLGREIGKSLLALSKKILPLDNTNTLDCVAKIKQWQDREAALAELNHHEEKVTGITDRAESLLAILEGCAASNAGELREGLASLFSKDVGNVTLSTIHKAKGLEWDLVIHLDPWCIPSRFAVKQAKQEKYGPLEQENNLKYVCETRVRKSLILVNLGDFQ